MYLVPPMPRSRNRPWNKLAFTGMSREKIEKMCWPHWSSARLPLVAPTKLAFWPYDLQPCPAWRTCLIILYVPTTYTPWLVVFIFEYNTVIYGPIQDVYSVWGHGHHTVDKPLSSAVRYGVRHFQPFVHLSLVRTLSFPLSLSLFLFCTRYRFPFSALLTIYYYLIFPPNTRALVTHTRRLSVRRRAQPIRPFFFFSSTEVAETRFRPSSSKGRSSNFPHIASGSFSLILCNNSVNDNTTRESACARVSMWSTYFYYFFF